jgi:hypothetical protein
VVRKEHRPAGLVACCSRKGHHGPENEDRYRVGRIGESKVLLIADGVTSSRFGGEAAQIVVDTFYEVLERAGKLQGRTTIHRFQAAYQLAVCRLSESSLLKFGKHEGYETTVIAIVEANDEFVITYLGDGRIYLVRGDLEQGIQLMVSHGVGGALGGAVGPYGLVGKPVYILHSKSFNSGEVVVAGTDGAFELGEGAVKATVIRMRDRLADTNALHDDACLQQAIVAVLDEMFGEDLLSDDATLGVLVSDKARKTLSERGQ